MNQCHGEWQRGFAGSVGHRSVERYVSNRVLLTHFNRIHFSQPLRELFEPSQEILLPVEAASYVGNNLQFWLDFLRVDFNQVNLGQVNESQYQVKGKITTVLIYPFSSGRFVTIRMFIEIILLSIRMWWSSKIRFKLNLLSKMRSFKLNYSYIKSLSFKKEYESHKKCVQILIPKLPKCIFWLN